MSSVPVTLSTAAKLSGSRVNLDVSSVSTPLGRGLVSPQSVSAGALLLRLDPLISVLDDPLLDKACSTCFVISKSMDDTVGQDLLKCTGCGIMRYCSKVSPKSKAVDNKDMSKKRLENTSFERMQISTIEFKYSTNVTSWRHASRQSLCGR